MLIDYVDIPRTSFEKLAFEKIILSEGLSNQQPFGLVNSLNKQSFVKKTALSVVCKIVLPIVFYLLQFQTKFRSVI